MGVLTGTVARAAMLLLGAHLALPSLAAEPITYQEEKIVNYAFATRLGSGVYDVNGRTVQIYRLPFAWTFRHEEPGRVGLRLRLPVTIGFFDFKAIDVVETGLPSHLDTSSFVPGLEVRVPVRPNWLLMPYAEAGIASDRAGDSQATVYSTGVRSVADFVPGRWRLALGSEAVYTGVNGDQDQPGDDFVSLEACLEARHGMGFQAWGKGVDYALYAAWELYYSDPQFPIGHQERDRLSDQYELGVTFGRVEPVKLFWGIELPRLGFGYRFGDGISVYRFVIGIPAPSLAR